MLPFPRKLVSEFDTPRHYMVKENGVVANRDLQKDQHGMDYGLIQVWSLLPAGTGVASE